MYEKVKLLVDYGADANGEISLLHMPVYYYRFYTYKETKDTMLKTVIYLWEHGANEGINVGTEWETSILHEAAAYMDTYYLKRFYHNEKKSMAYLLNAQDVNGETPLFWAVREGKLDNCLFLIEEGARIDIQNNEGETVYDIAMDAGHRTFANMKDVCVLQEKDLGEKVFAIIYDRKDLAYCIFDKLKIKEEDHYIVRNIYKLPWKSNTNRLLDADEYKEMMETENEYVAKAELQTIVVEFYVKNGVVSSDKEQCEGYSLNPYISNIEVEEGNLSVEPVRIGEDLLYMWTLCR